MLITDELLALKLDLRKAIFGVAQIAASLRKRLVGSGQRRHCLCRLAVAWSRERTKCRDITNARRQLSEAGLHHLAFAVRFSLRNCDRCIKVSTTARKT